MRSLKRGEIYYAALSPINGSVQGGTRPALILQNNVGNKFSSTTIVAAMTCSEKKIKNRQLTHVLIRNCGTKKKAIVLLEQIMTIDQNRLKGFIGTLNQYEMKKIDQAIEISLGLSSTEV